MRRPNPNPPFKGRRLGLTIPRRIVADFMWLSSKVPYVTSQRRLMVKDLIIARENDRSRASWQAIFAKAFAIVAEDCPQLKQAYLSLPWPHIYEYDESVVGVATEREFLGDTGVFLIRIRNPASLSIAHLSDLIKHPPFEETRFLRKLICVARCPLLIRRLLWWLNANLARQRKHFLGTFGLSSTSALGAEIVTLRSPLTSTLTYGSFDQDGNVDVRIMFDHRVLDGATAARILVRLEQVLNDQLLNELRKT